MSRMEDGGGVLGAWEMLIVMGEIRALLALGIIRVWRTRCRYP